MSWRTECGNQFHAGWCRHISTGKVYTLPGVGYPIQSEDELQRAMEAMGSNTSADRAEARRKIIEVAKENGLMSVIPDNWNEDGTLK